MKRLALWLVLFAFPAMAQERILHYGSEIDLRQDGSMEVTETIRAVAEGDQIKRGIYRDFPTTYKSGRFTSVEVPFEVIGVRRDGATESYHTEKRSNGIRVYAGQADRFVEAGEHTWEIQYRTGRQIGFFGDHDELYWNVTGNGWSFPIEWTTADVRLPGSIPEDRIGHEAYTGAKGEKGQSYSSDVDPRTGMVHFETTAPLGPGEGLTIVVTWPKGFIAEPTAAEKREEFLRANPSLTLAAGSLALVILYYFLAWLVVGRDPEKGTIIPEYGPPDGIGPAGVRFIHRMGFDKTCFAVEIIDMAVKGYLTIEEKGGEFTIRKKDQEKKSSLTVGEKKIADILMLSKEFTFEKTEWKEIKRAVDSLQNWLKVEHEGRVFLANRGWVVPGVLISIVAPILTALKGPEPAGALFMSVWLSFWSLGVVALVTSVIAAWKTAARGGAQGCLSAGGALFLTFFSLPFVGGEIFGLFMLYKAGGVWTMTLLLSLLLVNAVFITIMKAPTQSGRRLMDRIDGFRMYLTAAESDRVRGMRPDRTPELFERFLPYAIALGVENEWAEQFESVLASSATAPGGGYRPGWYSGTADFATVGASGFASAIGSSMSSAISSSSSAPGSSSGSGGGGSSGGGGGGGGGGGW